MKHQNFRARYKILKKIIMHKAPLKSFSQVNQGCLFCCLALKAKGGNSNLLNFLLYVQWQAYLESQDHKKEGMKIFAEIEKDRMFATSKSLVNNSRAKFIGHPSASQVLLLFLEVVATSYGLSLNEEIWKQVRKLLH